MSEMQRPLLRCAANFAGGLLGSIGLCAGIGFLYDSQDQGRLDRNRLELVGADGNFEEANRNVFRVQQEIGESCLALVKVYMADGQLSKTPEDTVVSDLMGAKGAPCGDTPTQARLGYRSLVQVNDALSQAESLQAANRQELKGVEADTAHSAMTKGSLTGSIIGMVLGGIFGGLARQEAKDYNRDLVKYHSLNEHFDGRGLPLGYDDY